MSDTYMKAAEMVADGSEEFSCWAVLRASGDGDVHYSTNQEVQAYAALFSPNGAVGGCWMCEEGEESLSDEIQDRRVIALLLMHEIVQAGHPKDSSPK